MRGAVLAYHAQNCAGYDYANNDHLALDADLAAVLAAGVPIVSLEDIARHVSGEAGPALPERFVAFSCDDGTLLDWRDYDHPEYGLQRALAGILRDRLAGAGLEGSKRLTAFVIASPEARAAIDAGCYAGAALSGDDWWAEAAREGLLAIGSHGWDHVHEVLPDALQRFGRPGDFHSVDCEARAAQQVDAASDYINGKLAGSGERARLFAYPYGHASDYLRTHYLPRHAARLRLVGAFSTAAQFVTPGCDPFAIPRFVHGDAWRTPEEFQVLLAGLLAP